MESKTLPPTPELDAVIAKVLSVSREEYDRRERAYQEAAAKNPKRRGPKPTKQ